MVGSEYTGELLLPQTLRLFESSAQGPEDDSVSCLFLATNLRMFDKGDKVLDAQSRQEVFISLSFELSFVVYDNDVWEAVPTNEVFLGEFLHLVGRNFSQESYFYRLGEVVDGDL